MKEWNEDREAQGENDITRIYHREIESMIKQLYPEGSRKYTPCDIDQLNYVIRRGPSSSDSNLIGKSYVFGPHQDYGMGAEAFKK